MKLSDFIYPNLSVARSVNLERDGNKSEQIDNYHITGKTIEIIKRFTSSLQGEKVSAWALTGPYGMGKSAFLNYLLALTGVSGQVRKMATKKLLDADPELHEEFLGELNRVVGEKGFFRVYVTAAYEPINNTLARGLENVLPESDLRNKKRILTRLKKLQKQKIIESHDLLAIFTEIQNITQTPLVIVIDEFGKNLDFMSHHHGKGDIFIIQQLAEMPSFYLWVCLHQAFDEYAIGLSTVQRQEWSKVQGRFENITFMESTAQMLYLMQKALEQDFPRDVRIKINNFAEKAHQFILKGDLADKDKLDPDTISNLYPLHPITVIALLEFCRKFAQNDRTLLSFLCSGDRLALPAYLEKTHIGSDLPVLGLYYLYDYFFNISSTAYSNRAESQRWIEIHYMVENAGYKNDMEKILLKTIGVLNLLSASLGVKADIDTIVAVTEGTLKVNSRTIRNTIESLVSRGIVLYRAYAGEYWLWEGSEFDVYGNIRKYKSKLAITDLQEILQEYLPLPPLIASRHAFETGTVRRFERRWLNVESLNRELVPQKGFDGLILYCFGTLAEPPVIPEACGDKRPLLIAYVPSQAALHELALEIAAARSVLEDSPELLHDSVARKEIKFRITVAEEQFRQLLSRLYAPGSEEVFWYSQGEKLYIKGSKNLSEELSHLCDICYDQCPRIGNEMINYEKLSGAASRARRELVEAMAAREGEEQLGLEGFGPEVAIYRSLILAEDLHVENLKTGYWQFALKSKKKSRLHYLWEAIDDCIYSAGDKGVTVAEILDKLGKPPFGLRRGPTPIYICLYLLARANEIAVFHEDTYRPYLSSSEMALMVKRPDLFVLKHYITTSIEQHVFNTYRSLLDTVKLEGNSGLRNSTMIGVVGPLIKFVEELPPYSRKTRQISLEAQRVRSAIINSVEPMRLLFEEIPQALGIEITEENIKNNCQEQLQEKLRSVLTEMERAYPTLNTRVQATMLNIFAGNEIGDLQQRQQTRMKPLLDICDDSELNPVLQAFVRDTSNPAEWCRGVAAIVIKKPLDSWDDQDFMPFAARLRDYADRIEQLEKLASINGYLLDKNSKLFSIMSADGRVKREVVHASVVEDEEIQKQVEGILALPEDKSKAILAVLADKLFGGDTHVS
ncbi:MAG: hypothetical protein ACOX2B_04920 [Syntrophothermaceae bacterium]|jgi:hypothetical protein